MLAVRSLGLVSSFGSLKTFQRPLLHLHRSFSSTQPSAELVKQLRQNTGASIGKCREALKETANDLEGAARWLRENGVQAVAAKSLRAAGEGLVACVCRLPSGGLEVFRSPKSKAESEGKTEGDGSSVQVPESAVLLEVNSETDFVAQNDLFKRFVRLTVDASARMSQHGGGQEGDGMLLSVADVEGTQLTEPVDASKVPSLQVGEALQQLSALVGEKLVIQRAGLLNSSARAFVSGYVHNEASPGVGRLGALVGLSAPDVGTLPEQIGLLNGFARALAMQAAATRPSFVTEASVPSSTMEAERQILKAAVLHEEAQSGRGGKSEEVVMKVVAGRLKKQMEDEVLELQEMLTWSRVVGEEEGKQLLQQAGKKEGGKLTVKAACEVISKAVGGPVRPSHLMIFGIGMRAPVISFESK
eukprot:Cvel_14221.t2-p1 / transcript=Cvel_14221.t2 / gene=Cvel_14221 / organism=Chromera_velia_CCMP2878 / gene_product=Elongation factor Ts, putative / transcript_product=Elongation factor Ts, putative / location=Cvel_scaffold1003:17888-19132(+) / protein_length=415 / sequence_SO=supercontig / SO=protein_coding / is_pseudo=false